MLGEADVGVVGNLGNELVAVQELCKLLGNVVDLPLSSSSESSSPSLDPPESGTLLRLLF